MMDGLIPACVVLRSWLGLYWGLYIHLSAGPQVISLYSFNDKCHLREALQRLFSLNKGIHTCAFSVVCDADQAWSGCFAQFHKNRFILLY